MQRGFGLRSYPAWVAASAVAMAIAYPIARAGYEFGWDASTPVLLRPVRILGLVLASLVLSGSQLLVLGRCVRSRPTWLAMGVLGWTGVVLGSSIATIGLPYDTPVELIALVLSLLGGGFLGLTQLPSLSIHVRTTCGWLASSTLAGPGLVLGFLLAQRWSLGWVVAGSLAGCLYGVVSGLGLVFLRPTSDPAVVSSS